MIHQTFQEVSRVVQTHLGNGYVLNMDDLFPLFLFVVVRARIRHLGTEIHLMDDLIDKNIQNGELDVMFTTLEVTIVFINFLLFGPNSMLIYYRHHTSISNTKR